MASRALQAASTAQDSAPLVMVLQESSLPHSHTRLKSRVENRLLDTEATTSLGCSDPHGTNTTTELVSNSNRDIVKVLDKQEDSTTCDTHTQGSAAVIHNPPKTRSVHGTSIWPWPSFRDGWW